MLGRNVYWLVLCAMAQPALAAGDVPGNSSTMAKLQVGEGVFGTFENARDKDWYRSALVKGQAYAVTAGAGEGECASIAAYRNNAKPLLPATTCADIGSKEVVGFEVVAPYSGNVFLEIAASFPDSFRSFPAAYGLSISEDCAGSTATTCATQVGQRVNGTFQFYRDADWRTISLVRGRTYRASYFAGQTVTRGFRLRNATGGILASGEDASETLTFKAPRTGSFFLEAWQPDGSLGAGSGDYRFVVEQLG